MITTININFAGVFNFVHQMAAVPCEGLPDRPCPKLRCDSTVHYTIFDLFLCHYCERIRGEENKMNKLKLKSAVGTDNSKNDGIKDAVVSESRPHKQSERPADAVTTALQQLQLKSKPKQKPNTVNDAVKPSCDGQARRPTTSSDAASGTIQPPSELDTTLLDIAFNDCDDAINSHGMSNTEHAATVNTVIEDQVSLLRAEVRHQRD